MIIYPNQKVPEIFTRHEMLDMAIAEMINGESENFRYVENEDFVIAASEVPLAIATMKIADLGASDDLIRALKRLDIEYVGECTTEIVTKIGVGIRTIEEINAIIKHAVTKYSYDTALFA